MQGMIARAITGAGLDLLELASRQISLEEVFIHQVTAEGSRQTSVSEEETDEFPKEDEAE